MTTSIRPAPARASRSVVMAMRPGLDGAVDRRRRRRPRPASIALMAGGERGGDGVLRPRPHRDGADAEPCISAIWTIRSVPIWPAPTSPTMIGPWRSAALGEIRREGWEHREPPCRGWLNRPGGFAKRPERKPTRRRPSCNRKLAHAGSAAMRRPPSPLHPATRRQALALLLGSAVSACGSSNEPALLPTSALPRVAGMRTPGIAETSSSAMCR